jgi:hypothetical protein
MKSNQIKKDLIEIEQVLRQKIITIGISNVAEILKSNRVDIQLWVHNKRNWTYNKILNIAERLGL